MLVSTAITVDLVANLFPTCTGELRGQAVTLEGLHRERRGALAHARPKGHAQAFFDQCLERRVLTPRSRLAALEQIVWQFNRGLHMVLPYLRYGSYGNRKPITRQAATCGPSGASSRAVCEADD